MPITCSQQCLDGTQTRINQALLPAITYWIALTMPNGQVRDYRDTKSNKKFIIAHKIRVLFVCYVKLPPANKNGLQSLANKQKMNRLSPEKVQFFLLVVCVIFTLPMFNSDFYFLQVLFENGTECMAKFLPRLSDVSEPLRQLTKKDVPFIWDQQHDRAFNLMKKWSHNHQFSSSTSRRKS